MANYLIKTVCLTLLFLLYSCNNNGNDNNILIKDFDGNYDYGSDFVFCNFDDSVIEDNDWEKYISEIDSDIIVGMHERLDSSGRTFRLFFRTERQYSSGSNPIKYCVSKNNNQIVINLDFVLEIGMTCDIGPARCMTDFGKLENGTYNFEINIAGKKNIGTLTVTSKNYKLSFANSNQLEIIDTVLNRVPDNTIWGLVGYHKESTITIVNDFLKSLEEAGTVKHNFDAGNYNYFQIDNNGNMLTPEYHGYWFAIPFAYHFPNNNLSAIEEVVKYYALNYGNSHLHIALYTTTGEQFLSWMIK